MARIHTLLQTMSSTDIAAIRILVVDDHSLYRRGLSALLALDPRISVIGDAADAGQALQKAHDLQPDVILLDRHMPRVSGVEVLPSLLAAAPRARILMLTLSEDEDDLLAALGAGASGYLLKNMNGDDLLAAVLRVFLGEKVIAPEMMDKLVLARNGMTTGISPLRNT